LNEERHYLHRVEDLVLFPDAGPALRRLQDADFLLFVVSNQSGVGRGYFTLTDVEAVNAAMCEKLATHGVQISKIYVAPEAPDQPSRGRKPSPQFFFDARDEFGLDLGQSYMIGDKQIDLQCGWNAGVKQCILVHTGYGLETEKAISGKAIAVAVVDNLSLATDWILADARESEDLKRSVDLE